MLSIEEISMIAAKCVVKFKFFVEKRVHTFNFKSINLVLLDKAMLGFMADNMTNTLIIQDIQCVHYINTNIDET